MISPKLFRKDVPHKKLGDIVIFLDHIRKPITTSDRVAGLIPYYGANGIQGYVKDFLFDEDLVLLAEDGGHFEDADRGVAYKVSGKTWVNNHAHVLRPTKNINVDYLFRVLQNLDLTAYINGTTRAKLTKANAARIEIPLPPLAEQQRIAELLDTADRILKLRESALAKLDQLAQSVFVDMFSNCTNFESIKSVVLKKKISQPDVNQHVWSLSLDQIESDTGNLQNKVMVEFKKLGSSTYFFEPPVILYSKLRPYLNKVLMPTDCGYATTELVPLYCNEKKVLPIYLLSVLRSKKFVEFANINSGGAKMPRVIMDKFWDYEFAVPSIQQQQKYADFFTLILNQKRHCLNAYTLNQALLSSLQHQSFAVN